jgi:hypothetical protein
MGFVKRSYVPFIYGVGGSQLIAFLVMGCWKAVMCLPSRVFVVCSKVPFRYGVGGRQLCAFLVGVRDRQFCAFIVGVFL